MILYRLYFFMEISVQPFDLSVVAGILFLDHRLRVSHSLLSPKKIMLQASYDVAHVCSSSRSGSNTLRSLSIVAVCLLSLPHMAAPGDADALRGSTSNETRLAEDAAFVAPHFDPEVGVGVPERP